MKKFTFLFLSLILPFLSHSQTLKGTSYKASRHATIRIADIKQVPDEGSGIKVPNAHWQVPDWKIDASKIIYRQAEKEMQQDKPSYRADSPAPDTSFVGLLDNQTSIPPDVNGAAGPEHIMETLNTGVGIMDREGNILFTTALGTFWAELPGSGTVFDPKITYDPYNDKWIFITPMGSAPSDSRIYFAVSVTSDPLGEWNFYWLDTDTQNILWFDYPNLGFNKNWISVCGIMRNSAFDAVEYVAFTIDKMAAMNGEESPLVNKFTTTLGSAMVPAFTYDPDMEDLYLMATADGNLEGYGYVNLYKISGEVEAPAFELMGSVGIPEPWENYSYNDGVDFLPQLGSAMKLNSIDARMQNMVVRNNKLWAVHHIYLPAEDPQRCAIQWWNLDTSGAILERGRIDDTDGIFSYAFASVAVNANEDVFIGHGIFSATQYAGAGYSYKAYYDEPNSMRNFYQYANGLAPYYKTFGGGRNRWGDYSAACVDPRNDIDFWALHEYADTPSSSDRWGTMIAYMKPNFPPVADFVSDEILIPVGETINFTDLTAGVPEEWNWEFEGAEPTESTLQNPADILYTEEGTFTVSLIASNELGTDTIVKEGLITASTSILPEVDFSSSKAVACVGETISFSDLSAYSPIQWEWQFDPSSVVFVNGTDASSQNVQVVFDEAVSYSVTLTVWNLNGSSTLTKFDMVMAGGYVPDFLETFEPGTFKSNEWKIANPDNDVTWELFTTGGTIPGNTSAGLDFSKYFAIGQRDRLITPPFNLEGLNNAVLGFQHAYAKKMPEISDSLCIYVSSDCGLSWTKIFADAEDGSGNFATHPLSSDFWPETQNDWCGNGWGAECIFLDLTDWAGMPNVQIAFETWSAYGNPLFLDNIMISQYTAIEESLVSESDFIIYPNPTNIGFSVSFSEKHNFRNIKIINQLGEMVYSLDFGQRNLTSEVQIQIQSKLTSGLYLVILSGNEKITTKKLLIR